MKEPLISIVMPVYNAGPYLIDAVASIAAQTMRDWRLICVDDGSTDGSGEVLDWFASNDERIRVIHQPNSGIVAALNRGCAEARGPLLCRMDADDIALPQRLEKQAEYLRRNPNCTVVGSAILEMDADGDPLAISALPSNHDEIVANLLNRKTGHFHPSTMFRGEAFEAVGGYRPEYQWVEDHDLWLRLAWRGQLANIPQVLLCYRQHGASVCWQRSDQQRQLMDRLLAEAYRARGKSAPSDLINTSTTKRKPAGPGKWSRAAAKGGFPKSAVKHLRTLLASDESGGYKTRMALECAARIPGGLVTRWLSENKVKNVPTFKPWHDAWSAASNTHPNSNRRVA